MLFRSDKNGNVDIGTIDGTGGCENNFDWKIPGHWPPGSSTEMQWTKLDPKVCECLRKSSRDWSEKVKIPRHSFGCNSNTSLRCLLGRCKVNFKPSFPYPLGYYKCKRYACAQWSTQRVTGGLGQCENICSKWTDFCDYWWGKVAGPPLTLGNLG